ncbi:MAG TPA: CorA family divalent cation transporter [Gaiellaceae bacterium]|nr:CorA family divalent cation transporter [Gaiellaceae bacterium]
MSHAILFDGDQVQPLDALSDRPQHLGGSMLLWVDVAREAEDVHEVAVAFGIDDETQALLVHSGDHAHFQDHGAYIHLSTFAPSEKEDGQLIALECVVAENWVVTAHDAPIEVLDEFAARASGSGDTGSLDGPTFLAALLEWVLGSYSAAFERIEQRLEKFDVEAMRGNGDADKDIERLVQMRLEVGTLRRALAAHRSALMTLRHPELEALGSQASSERYESLLGRFESAMQEARDAREAIVGSFDVLIARGGHRTNEIMKVLTLTSVILLPGALVAGVMGMNFKVGLFDTPAFFWVVVAVIVAFAPITIGVAKLRDWI